MDNVLALRRVLNADEIARLAKDGPDGVVDPASDRGVLYTMEEPATDKRLVKDQLPADGAADAELPLGGIEWGDVQLLINYSTSTYGGLRCEIQGENGQPLPGFSLAEADVIYGDSIERPVSWGGKTELKSLVGKPVKLRFELRDADLYAIRFGRARRRKWKT